MGEVAKRHDGRPSPDALLIDAANERRGHFKLFLGAAPGVGKTFEMLQAAQAKRADGVDVVIGVVETHGRGETAALTEGLEVIPRRQLAYRGHRLAEMDLDAILARRPKLVLVDELAHTNGEGSRHPKRYLDVQEILAAGIDVYSTLNVQHLESLNDVVARITRIRVRETLPDEVLTLANEIEVVDLTPEALIRRLNEGKVYVRDQAQRALKHYFSPGNLTALRELALRATAQRVDDQMVHYMQSHAIDGPWPASDRVLVCISADGRSGELVRYARRMADRLKATKWTALYVEGAGSRATDENDRDRIADALRLAERLGAETVTLSGQRVADEILAYARRHNVTHIVIGNSKRSRLHTLLHGSIIRDLVRRSGNISVHLIAGDSDEAGPGEPAPGARIRTATLPTSFGLLNILGAVGVVAAATGVAVVVNRFVPLPNLSLIFLAGVLLSALRWGLRPSLVAAVLSAAAYNYFFLPPVYSFTIADPANVVSLIFFLVVAFLVSNLATQVQRYGKNMAERARLTAELYAFSRKLAGIGSIEDLLWVVTYQIAAMLRCEAVVLLPDDGRLEVRGAYPPEDQLDEADRAAAHWTWSNNKPAGRGADTLPGGRRLFLPLQTERGPVGVVGVTREHPPLLTPDERRLLDALMDQAAVALERVSLADDVDQVRLQAETERLRNALLTSVSHDLRTPLATIVGSLSSLKSFGAQYDETVRRELTSAALDEAERLNRFVGNLLDMTKLEFGGLNVKREPCDVAEIVATSLARAKPLLGDRVVTVDLPADLPPVLGDAALLDQVIFNLLDNAGKYAESGTPIEIGATSVGGWVTIVVADRGGGIPLAQLEAVFNKFTRLQAGDGQRAGTGLGLPICRGFVEAMGGTIVAGNRTDGSGAVFSVNLVAASRPEAIPSEVEEAVHAG